MSVILGGQYCAGVDKVHDRCLCPGVFDGFFFIVSRQVSLPMGSSSSVQLMPEALMSH